MIEIWGIGITAVITIITIVLFFNSIKTSIIRLSEKMDNIERSVERHIFNEEIESARQDESRRHVRDILKLLNKIRCSLKKEK